MELVGEITSWHLLSADDIEEAELEIVEGEVELVINSLFCLEPWIIELIGPSFKSWCEMFGSRRVEQFTLGTKSICSISGS